METSEESVETKCPWCSQVIVGAVRFNLSEAKAGEFIESIVRAFGAHFSVTIELKDPKE